MFRTLRFYHSFFKFLSTPSSRRATGGFRFRACAVLDFYPRPPRGGRPYNWALGVGDYIFLSTPSARRATVIRRFSNARSNNFYPRPPRGGRPGLKRQGYRDVLFLSTPSARRATLGLDNKVRNQLFLSTPSARRATRSQPSTHTGAEISIHALREEGDNHKETVDQDPIDFYPRPPRGGRPPLTSSAGRPSAFLSTPSARRATYCPLKLRSYNSYFYPRPPRGGRPPAIYWRHRRFFISIHALREEGDINEGDLVPIYCDISIHALREEGDWVHFDVRNSKYRFLSTPSARRATVGCTLMCEPASTISIHALREEGDQTLRLCF